MSRIEKFIAFAMAFVIYAGRAIMLPRDETREDSLDEGRQFVKLAQEAELLPTDKDFT